jgi:hypothetical protein
MARTPSRCSPASRSPTRRATSWASSPASPSRQGTSTTTAALHGQRGRRQQEGVRHGPGRQLLGGHPHAEVILCRGTNVAECFPITTDYIWRRGTRARSSSWSTRGSPRSPAPADLHLPCAPGRLGAVHGHAPDPDRGRLARPRVHRPAHERLGRAEKAALEMPLEGPRISGVNLEDIVRGRRMWGRAKTELPAACPRHRAPHQGRGQRAFVHQPRARHRPHRASPAAATARSPARATARAVASTATSATSFPATGTSRTPSTESTSPASGASPETRSPARASPPPRSWRMIHAGEIKALLSICFNPLVSLPDANFTREALEKLEHYVAIDFFLNETAHHADIVLPGSLHEEEEGTPPCAEGRVIRIRAAVTPPGDARSATPTSCSSWPGAGRGKYFDHFKTRGHLQRAAGGLEGRHRRLLRHHLSEDRGQHGDLLAMPVARGPPRHAAAVRGPKFPTRTARRTSTPSPTGRSRGGPTRSTR